MKFKSQFRLRTIFIAIAAIALLVQLIAGPMRQARQEQLRRGNHEYDSLKHSALLAN
jgi:hypothetical protein